MKSLSLVLCCLSICCVHAFAQKLPAGKPAIFTQLPAVIPVHATEFTTLFNSQQGDAVHQKLGNQFPVDGVVTTRTFKFNQLHTVGIRLPQYHNLLLVLNKRLLADNSWLFSGRIISPEFSDSYELKHIKGDDYQLIRMETEQRLPTCNQQ